MAAPKGHKYWEFRNKHGRDYKYTPEALWDEAIKYFNWVEENPLWESVLVSKGIKVINENGEEIITYSTALPKMRAMTIEGFCLFADICKQTYYSYKQKDNFIDITTRIDDVIRTQKFEGAAAALLNSNIIARDLGLKDKQEIDDKRDKPSIHLSIDGKEVSLKD